MANIDKDDELKILQKDTKDYDIDLTQIFKKKRYGGQGVFLHEHILVKMIKTLQKSKMF